MTDQTETIQARLAAMKEQYIRQLPDKAEDLRKLWRDIQRHGWTHQAAGDFRIMVHSLAGSSGTFNLNELSERARALDLLLGDICNTGNEPSRDMNTRAEELFNDLLPLFDPDRDQGDNAGQDDDEKDLSPNQRILLVDDDAEFADYIKASLDAHGYEVKIILEPSRLNHEVMDFKPAVIIMDMIFPDNDLEGAGYIENLRKSGNQTPVIYASIRDDMASRLSALRTGAQHYLTKPFDIKNLLSCVGRSISSAPETPYRVLIVDDEKELAQVHASILESAGMKADVLTDPLQIIDTVKSFNPELILMDIYMPGCNGLEAAMVLRQIPDYDMMPIVFLSGEQRIDKQLSAMNLGGDDFIVKPVEKDYLIQVVTARIKRSRTLTDARNQLQSSMRKLARAKRDAELANRSKSYFLSSMSHELRTPLNSILGFAQLLEMDMDNNLNDKQKGNVDNILKAGWHLLELINEVLDLSKIEAGKVTVDIHDVEIQSVVREAVSLTQTIAAQKGIAISNNVTNDPIIVLADPTRLRQVIVNILSNAVKYNNENGTVDVSIRQNPDNMIELLISDSGMGIPKHAMKELFTAFNRLGAEESNIEGNGLGLAISHKLMNLMNGDIGAYNNSDVGSTFWLKLQTSTAKTAENKKTVAN